MGSRAGRCSSRRSSTAAIGDPEAEAVKSLERLGVDHVDHVDLYIILWPQGGPTWAWPGMEGARDRGYARSIGVSNFSARELEQVIAIATNHPVVDQVQFAPHASLDLV